MKQVFELVRPACDFASVLSDEACLNVIQGRMEAKSASMRISQPCDLPDFSAPVVDIDFALRKVENPELKLTDSHITLKGGSTTRIRRLPFREALVKPNIETSVWNDPDDLLSAIDDVFPFTSGDKARPWSEGARFDGKKVTATDSVTLCQATLDTTSGLEGVTIPRAVLAYIRQRRADIAAWGVDAHSILLEFSDGGWAQAGRMSAEMPDRAVELLDMVVPDWDNFQGVTTEYRGAFLRAAEWAEETISIHPDKLLTGKYSSEHDEYAETVMDGEGPLLFSAKHLETVMMAAKSINFKGAPVPFTTERGSRGLISGRA